MYTKLTTRIKLRNLKSYLASDVDAFPLQRHFHNWRKQPAFCPILFIRSETIWDNLDVLQSFLDLPTEAIALFPKKKRRNSSMQDIDLREQEKLNQLYGDFREEIKKMPDVYVRPADWFIGKHAEDEQSNKHSRTQGNFG